MSNTQIILICAIVLAAALTILASPDLRGVALVVARRQTWAEYQRRRRNDQREYLERQIAALQKQLRDIVQDIEERDGD